MGGQSFNTAARRRGPAPGTPRKTRMSRDQRRSQLLDVAEETFGEVGFHEATMDLVAARADVTKPVLYTHFGSKDQLLAAVVQRAMDHLVAQLTSSIAEIPPSAEPLVVLEAQISTYMHFVHGRKAAFWSYLQEGVAIAAAGTDPEVIRREMTAPLAELMRLVPGLEDLPIDQINLAAEVVIATTERVTTWAFRTGASPEESTKVCVDFVWGGLERQLFPL